MTDPLPSKLNQWFPLTGKTPGSPAEELKNQKPVYGNSKSQPCHAGDQGPQAQRAQTFQPRDPKGFQKRLCRVQTAAPRAPKAQNKGVGMKVICHF